MSYEFNVLIEKDSDGYFVASVPCLRGCHTQAKSLDLLMKRVRKEATVSLGIQMDDARWFLYTGESPLTAASCHGYSATARSQRMI